MLYRIAGSRRHLRIVFNRSLQHDSKMNDLVFYVQPHVKPEHGEEWKRPELLDDVLG